MEQTQMSADENLPGDHRSGFVSVVGRPNVGKSTLLNAYLGQKIAIVSPKPQTTRRRILGILTQERAQVIFVDTPGIHQPFHKLGESMVRTAVEAIPDADVLLWLVEGTEAPTDVDRQIAALVQEHGQGIPLIL
ncbi:MAG: GTPase Era, partial [Anaerolineae bacterium]